MAQDGSADVDWRWALVVASRAAAIALAGLAALITLESLARVVPATRPGWQALAWAWALIGLSGAFVWLTNSWAVSPVEEPAPSISNADPKTRPAPLAVEWIAAVLLGSIASALQTTDGTARTLIALSAIVASVFFVWIARTERRVRRLMPEPRAARGRLVEGNEIRVEANSLDGGAPSLEQSENESCTQHWRRQTTAQLDAVYGWLVSELPAGQWVAVAHIGFCPPLLPVPQIAVEADNDDVSVKVVEVFPQGARLEIHRRRGAVDVPLRVVVEVSAESAQQAEDAALQSGD